MARKSLLTPEIQTTIVSNLTLGCTIADACQLAGITERAYYYWVSKGEAGKSPEYVQFFQSVTQAQAKARQSAVVAIRTGIAGTKSQVVENETFSETRFRRNSKGEDEPYTYTRSTKTERNISNPPDWRAGVEYLKRRDSEHWSDRLNVHIDGMALKQLEVLLKLFEQNNIPASDGFNAMIQQFADMNSEQ